MFSVPTPEDFCAVGDGVADEFLALERVFNSWSISHLYRDSVALALRPGKTYAFEQPLRVHCGTSVGKFKLRLYGNGATLAYRGDPVPDAYALQVGHRERDQKAFYTHISDLYLDAGNDCAGGLFLGYGDFCLYENVLVTGKAHEANIRVMHQNSLSFQGVSTSGGEIGALFGPVTNVFHWHAGKVQNHRRGIVYSGGVFALEQIDLSFIREWAIVVQNGSSGRIACYTEKTGADIINDPGGCVLLHDANSIIVEGLLNCGGGSDRRSAGYAVRCVEGTGNIRVDARAKGCQRAFVDADESCQRIVVGPTASCATGGHSSAQPCPLDDGARFQNLAALYLMDAAHPAAPASIAPVELDAWIKNSGAVVLGEVQPDQRGDGRAQVASFPESAPASGFEFQYRGAAVGEVYRMELRARLVRFHEPDIEQRATDLALLRMRIVEGSAGSAQHHVRMGPGWQDYVLDLSVEAGNTLVFFVMNKSLSDPIDVAIDFIRVHRLRESGSSPHSTA